MMNLIRHHRLHIPNGLAMFAALLLLISSVAGFKSSSSSLDSAQKVTASTQVEAAEGHDLSDSNVDKRRGLNLGLLLFRR